MNLLRLTQQRLLVFALAFSLFIVWRGSTECIYLFKSIDFSSISPSLSFPPSISFNIELHGPGIRVLAKAFFAVVCGSLITMAIDWLIISQHANQALRASQAENISRIQELLCLLTNASGIERIYPHQLGKPIRQQLYASDIRESVTKSTHIKLLSIAGFEYLGNISGALFFDILDTSPAITCEAILLSPEKGDKVITERLHQLQSRDPLYGKANYIENIRQTIDRLKELRGRRTALNAAKVDIRLTQLHPVFRLLICDDCLYMSTYENSRHGHESPVYKISKVPLSENNGRLSLYNSFSLCFENAKRGTKKVA